jgi:hypothetical protein
MDKIQQIKKDYETGGVIFTLFYIISTAIIPNIMIHDKIKDMDKLSLFFWTSLIILWQVYILNSIYKYLNNEGSEYDNYTYKLFINGGWYNFQKWLSFFAEDIFEDILFLAVILLIPLNITEDIDGKTRALLMFAKIGLFFLFTYFIIGPPQYNIKKQYLTPVNYFNTILKFQGNIDKGIYNYFNINKLKILKILFGMFLILAVYLKKK